MTAQPVQLATPVLPAVPSLYTTTIRHVRSSPFRHAFTYTSYWWLVDLDALPSYRGPLRRFAEFLAEDHLGDPARTLRQNVDAKLAENGIDLTGGRVLMLANARVLGHTFNPLSVYWCLRADGSLACVLAEVHNTYGGRHTYVVDTDERGLARLPKAFYVSPFHPVDGDYTMSLPLPTDRLDLVVTLHRPDSGPFVAAVSGTRVDASTRNVVRAALRRPLVTLVVAARIRVHGIWLYAKRLPIIARTPADLERS